MNFNMKLALVITCTAILISCDPAATTRLVLRPSDQTDSTVTTATLSSELSESIITVESFLVAHGFSLNHRNRNPKCDRSSSWTRVSSDTTGKFETFAVLCATATSVDISFSDWSRFRSSETTQKLAKELHKTLFNNQRNINIDVN
jgi:hypothetical protein